MSYQMIDYKDKKILHIDFTHCESPEEMLSMLREMDELDKSYPWKNLTLINLTGQLLSMKFISEAIRLEREIFGENTEKAAIIGVCDIQKVLIDMYNNDSKAPLRYFKHKKEAIEYLAS